MSNFAVSDFKFILRNMKFAALSRFILFVVISIAAVGCGDKASEKELKANEKLAIEHGRLDADKVIKAAPGSMARERAVLAIRAREQEILQLGDTAAAEAYINAAEQRLDSLDII